MGLHPHSLYNSTDEWFMVWYTCAEPRRSSMGVEPLQADLRSKHPNPPRPPAAPTELRLPELRSNVV